MIQNYIIGGHLLGTEEYPRVSTRWTAKDRCNTMKARWGLNRMGYRVKPDLYAVGTPGRDSRVFVTANYKLSFDHLRRALNGLDAWILVLDTKGINVWCAAGKGVFSTKEVVRRIRIHHLEQVVDHRRIIVPQLGATGVSAHKVRRMTGFSVVYGPVRAVDIPAFLESDLKATDEMRRVTFPLKDRLKLIPVDIFYGRYYLLLVPAVFALLAGLGPGGYSVSDALHAGGRAVLNLYAGYLAGCVLAPALLPWLPFRRFSLKGLLTGWLTALLLFFAATLGKGIVEPVAWFLMIGGISSFMAMNFTGSSTFTSLSGVQKEMKTALPAQIVMASLGVAGWMVSRFLS